MQVGGGFLHGQSFPYTASGGSPRPLSEYVNPLPGVFRMTRSQLRRSTGVPLSLLILLGLPAPLASQAVLVGRTISDSTGDPITGVEVVVEKLNSRAESDREGRFTIGGLPWGIQTALVRKIGYRPVRLRLIVVADDSVLVDVRLRRSVVELEPLEVTVSTVRPGMEDFARRRIAGFGRFFDAKELRQADHRRLSDLLTGVRGVRPISRGFRTVLVSSRSNCPMAIWLDGMQIFSPGSRRPVPDINEFATNQLEGIEVYRGPAETPAELSGTGGGCGVVALWTRRS